MFWLKNKKNIFMLRTLNLSPELGHGIVIIMFLGKESITARDLALSTYV